jgi:hypothetical protein
MNSGPISQNKEMMWHNDGHILELQINKAELEVLSIHCPHEEGDGECHDPYNGCMIKFFIRRYGLECNAGSCPATPQMTICWTLIGDKRNIEDCQLWFMPLNDDVFAAWLNTAMGN